MSSVTFETNLIPHKRIRLGLLALAVVASLTGTALILLLPVVPVLKIVFCVLWLMSGIVELRTFCRGMARLRGIRIRDDGRLEGVGDTGETCPLSLCSGSVVLDSFAWLRFRFADGLCYGELLTGNAIEREQWRRLQLLWRQQAALFGRLAGS